MSMVLPSVANHDYAIHSNVEQMKSAVQRQTAVYVRLVSIVMGMAGVSAIHVTRTIHSVPDLPHAQNHPVWMVALTLHVPVMKEKLEMGSNVLLTNVIMVQIDVANIQNAK